MRAKILIISVLMIAVLVSSGCVQQQCPESCDDGNDCTKDYCSAVTDYRCKNDAITPCCGNNVCEAGECGSCSQDCSEEDCAPFTVEAYHSTSSHTNIPITNKVTFNVSPIGLDEHIYFHIEAGDEKVENLEIYASCGGVLKQNNQGGYTEYVKSVSTGRIKAPFDEKVAYDRDIYGKNIGEVRIFHMDYFINNEGVLLDEKKSTAILMNPHGTVNYRIWFNSWSILPRIGEGLNSTFVPGKYTIQCLFDFVSQNPSYVVNKEVNIYFVTKN